MKSVVFSLVLGTLVASANTAQAVTTNDACTDHFLEANADDACEAHRNYLQQCPSHVFATLSENVVARKCQPVTTSDEDQFTIRDIRSQCVQLAASPYGQTYAEEFPTAGLRASTINRSAAIAACRLAVDAFPEEAGLKTLLATALEMDGRCEEADQLFLRAHDMGDMDALPIRAALAFQTAANAASCDRPADRLLFDLRRSAYSGHPTGMVALSFVILEGSTSSADLREAALVGDALTAFAAPQLEAFGHFILGVSKSVSPLVDNPSYEEAAERLQTAVTLDPDFAEALGLLGYFQLEGLGVSKSPSIAYDLYSAAFERGSATAAFSLAILYEYGEGTETNPERAADLFLTAILFGQENVIDQLPNASRATRRAIQTRMQQAGFYDGPIDGLLGPQSRTALRQMLELR